MLQQGFFVPFIQLFLHGKKIIISTVIQTLPGLIICIAKDDIFDASYRVYRYPSP